MILIESFLIIMMEGCIITNPTGTEYVALIDNDEKLAYEPIKAEFVNSGCMYCDENAYCTSQGLSPWLVFYPAAFNIFSIKIPYPRAGSLTRTWVN